ncbi:MAG: hypothetical protein IJK93_06765 [Muribaculaceae bacterium]|nr:hypothetical protein [Muribaculaceae bacterium]
MKKILIALLLITGAQGQANAQFLKKLGNAIEKASKTIDDVADAVLGDNNSNSNSNKKERMIGKAYKIGETKISQYGRKDSGIKITNVSATRVYGHKNVILNFQLYNSTEYSYDIIMGFFETGGGCMLVDDNGNQYTHGWTDLGEGGEVFNLYDCQKNAKILDDTKLNCRLLIADVPSKVVRFKRAELPIAYITKNQTFHDNCTFKLENIPITLLPSLKADGVHGEGAVLLGDSIKAIPQSIHMMYDRYNVTDYPDKNIKMFTFFKDGETMFKALSYDNETIAMIFLDTPKVPFKVGDSFYLVNKHIKDEDIKFCTKKDDGNLVFKDQLIKMVDDPKNYGDMIGQVFIGKLPNRDI